MISAEQFLDILERKDLLPEQFLRTLRRRVAESDKPVSAAAVARQLIKLGHLTPALAERLLAAPLSAQATSELPESEGEDEFLLAPPRPEGPRTKEEKGERPHEEEELGLAPLEEDEEQQKRKPQPRPEEDDESELIPLGREEAEAPSELTPVEEKEAKPARPQAGAPKSKPTGKAPSAKRPQAESQKTKQPAQPKTPAAQAPQRPAKQPAPGGSSLLDEELTPLEDAGGGLLDNLMATASMDAAASPLAPVPQKKGHFGMFRRKRPSAGKAKVWDSPLMMVGGGTLLVLLILLGVLLLVVERETGEKMLEPANEDYGNGSYTQAIFKYDAFLEKFPHHPDASLARVRRGLALMRQATEGTNDWPRALDVAKEVLDEIATEPEFKQSHAEMASLLPAIARGLADQARKTPDPVLVEKSRETLALVSKYVPKSLQSAVTLEGIDASLGLTTRELARDAELAKAIAAIGAAVKQGNTPEAYRVRYGLLKQYPDLEGNAGLAEAMLAISRAQQATVKAVQQEQAAETVDPPTPVTASVTLARQNAVETVPGAGGQVVFALAAGSLYGLDGASGSVLWRRAVGSRSDGRSPRFLPSPLSDTGQGDVLVADTVRNEILRIEAATGRLRWRHPLSGPLAAGPVVAAGEALAVTGDDQGSRLVRISLESGSSASYVRLPQPVRVAPAVDLRRDSVYLVAEHSNLYVISLADGHCKEVVYLGHPLDSITATPVVVSRFLLVAENDKGCRLRVFSVESGSEGPSVRPLQEIPLKGRVDTPPLVADRRMAVVTDLGAIYMFEISGTNVEKPLGKVGEKVGEGREDLVRFPLLASGQFWVAGDQLAKYDVQAARGRLMPKAIVTPDEGAVFVQPLTAIGQTLYHARYEIGLPGVLVSAVEMGEGKRLWQTHLAAPPASEPIVDSKAGSITCATAAAALFRVDAAALKGQTVVNQPLAAADTSKLRHALSSVVELGDGLLVAGAVGSPQVYVFDPKQPDKQFATLALPGPLSSAPVGFAGGVLAPCTVGQVVLLDPRTGGKRLEPFQPPLQPGVQLHWSRPAATGPDEFVIADGGTRVWRVGIKEKPKPHLAVLASVEVDEPIVSPIALAGQHAFAVDQTGTLASFALPELKRAEVAAIGGRCAWGPQRVGTHVLLTTDRDEMLFIGADQKLAGRMPLAYGPLAGTPLELEGSYVLASASGVIWRVKPPTGGAPGTELAKIETARPLATGPVLLEGQLLVGGRDGSLYRVPLPEAKQPR